MGNIYSVAVSCPHPSLIFGSEIRGKEGSSSDESEPLSSSEDQDFKELQSRAVLELAARQLDIEAKAKSNAEAMKMRKDGAYGLTDEWKCGREEQRREVELEALVNDKSILWKYEHGDEDSQADAQAGEQASELEEVET